MATSTRDSILAIADLVARTRPELLDPFLKLSFRTRGVFEELAGVFEVGSFRQLRREILRGSLELGRLEKHGGSWQVPEEVLEHPPQLPALLALCRARQRNVSTATQRARLERIERKLMRAAKQRETAWIHEFLEVG